MAGFDALVIADALANVYKPANLSPPVGYPAMRVSTARLPNNIPTSPWVLVVLRSGEIVIGPSQEAELEYHVLFHYAKHTGDTARDMTAMLAWIGVLLTGTFTDATLGLTATQHVKSAFPTTFSLEVFTYGGDEYYGWDIVVNVILRDLGWVIA